MASPAFSDFGVGQSWLFRPGQSCARQESVLISMRSCYRGMIDGRPIGLLETSEVTYAEGPSQDPALSRTSLSVNFLLLGPEAPA